MGTSNDLVKQLESYIEYLMTHNVFTLSDYLLAFIIIAPILTLIRILLWKYDKPYLSPKHRPKPGTTHTIPSSSKLCGIVPRLRGDLFCILVFGVLLSLLYITILIYENYIIIYDDIISSIRIRYWRRVFDFKFWGSIWAIFSLYGLFWTFISNWFFGLSGPCPYCGKHLDILPETNTSTCPSCQNTIIIYKNKFWTQPDNNP